MASVVAYIDGFNLYHGLHDRYARRMLWLDLERLAADLRPNDTLVAVRYFTAMVRSDPLGEVRQNVYIDALKAHSTVPFNVVLGRFQPKQMSCRTCGATWMSYEEKETDINIATSLISDAATGSAEIALLVSADSDLCTAIKTARRVASRAGFRWQAVVAFPPRRRSSEIASIAPAFTIGDYRIRHTQLPSTVIDPTTGQKFARPAYWS